MSHCSVASSAGLWSLYAIMGTLCLQARRITGCKSHKFLEGSKLDCRYKRPVAIYCTVNNHELSAQQRGSQVRRMETTSIKRLPMEPAGLRCSRRYIPPSRGELSSLSFYLRWPPGRSLRPAERTSCLSAYSAPPSSTYAPSSAY